MLSRGLTVTTETLDNFGATKARLGPFNFKTAAAFTFVPSSVESVSAFFNRDLIVSSALWACEVMCDFVGNWHKNSLLK